MSRLKLALCDKDEVYCMRLDEFLRGHLSLPFDIFSFTDSVIMKRFVKENEVSLLMVSEQIYGELDEAFWGQTKGNVLVLDEGLGSLSMVCEDGPDAALKVKVINKYQAATGIVGEIIDYCAKSGDDFSSLSAQTIQGKGKVIGFYTPLGKCGQTTMAVNVAKHLSKDYKVVFLSLESFSALAHNLGIEGDEDITDLLYYADCEREKFSIYLERIKRTKDGVDFILPARTGMQIKEINLEKMNNLLSLLIGEGGYDYVLMDMTEYPSDFFDIAMSCDKVITITRANPADRYKIAAYEEVLAQSGFEELSDITVKCQLPDISKGRVYENFLKDLLEREGIVDGSKV